MTPSAKGIASQTPVILKNLGNVIKVMVIKPKVLRKEIMADILPFDSAVKKAETKILKPLKRKLKEKIIKPFLASRYNKVLFGVKKLTIFSPNTNDKVKIINDDISINNFDKLNIFLNYYNYSHHSYRR